MLISSTHFVQLVLPHVVLQVVELISGGAQIAVTNENKMHYLNLLAQYRLASQVRDEVEHFLKGKETSTAAVCRHPPPPPFI